MQTRRDFIGTTIAATLVAATTASATEPVGGATEQATADKPKIHGSPVRASQDLSK
jgi:hypothetical protein